MKEMRPKKSSKQQKVRGSIVTSGKRKRAIARAVLKAGTGDVRVNNRPINVFPHLSRLALQEPLVLTQKVLPDELSKINIYVTVRGGGAEAQVEASRLAIARALVAHSASKELRDAFVSYDRHLLVADVRRKETRKPGDSKARAKRQKSYR